MLHAKRLLTAFTLALFTGLNVSAQKATYAPTPPAMFYNDAKKTSSSPEVAQAAAEFSIGDPTDEEQMHLELINRARANANAEALRMIALAASDQDVFEQFVTAWNVDVDLMKAQFATNPPVAPLSFNAKLINAARGHSQYQFDNALQTHTGSGGTTSGQRATAVGYLWSNLGENVFLNAVNPEHGHAAFEVDWGPGPGGMQTPPGHRDTIHERIFVEVGIGIVKGFHSFNGNEAGPQVVTEDFAKPQTATTYITGVAYYDINGNNFYDLGEGLPNVRVTVDGVSTFAITATSGGYSIPVPPNRSHTVRFNAAGYPESASTISVTTDNSKVDFKPAYTVPAITSGPSIAFVGIDNIYTFAALPGATGYRALITQFGEMPVEGAEGALDHLTITTFGGYPFVSTAVKASGAKSFHLGQMLDNTTLDPQTIEFNDRIYVSAGATVDFKSRLGLAGDAQVATVEVSVDNEEGWTKIWTQPGAAEETQFSQKSVSLAAYVGKTIHVRFNFDFVGGNVYILPGTNDPNFNRYGWYIDDITFVNAKKIEGMIGAPTFATPQFAFRPIATGSYQIEFQAVNGARIFPFGPGKAITVEAAPAIPSLFSNITTTPTTISFEFGLTGGSATSFVLQSAPSVTGAWETETGAVFSGPDGQNRYSVTVGRNGEIRFYRVGAQ